MISRRLFLKAAASLAALPAVAAAGTAMPGPGLPATMWNSKLRIYTEGGFLLAEGDLKVIQEGAGWLFPVSRFDVLNPGTAGWFEWDLPNGETLRGSAGAGGGPGGADLHMNSAVLSTGATITFTGNYKPYAD